MLERLVSICLLLKRLKNVKRKTKIVSCSLLGCVSGVPTRLLYPLLLVGIFDSKDTLSAVQVSVTRTNAHHVAQS